MLLYRTFTLIVGWALIAGAADFVLAAGALTVVPITVINYSKYPVHATAVPLEAALLDRKLGLPPGAPLRVRRADNYQIIPLSHSTEDGQSVVRLFVAIPPESRLDLLVERADQWPSNSLVEARPDLLRNGVVRMALGKKGWKLGFEADKAALIEDGALDFWMDHQNRGRIMNSNPKDLGLIRYADASLERREAFISADGRPSIRIIKRLTGFAKDLTVVETFELAPGLPLLICRVHWQNDGDRPLWVAYVGSGDGIKGRWSKELMPGPLIERKKSPLQGDLNGGETRPAWVGQLCRISMESPATGCGVGLSTLLPTPGKVGQGSMVWGCSGSGFQCNFIDPVQGQFPFLVKPHSVLTNGFAFLLEQSGVSVFRQTVALWTALQKEKLPRLAPPCAVFVGGEAIHPQTVDEWGGTAGTLPLFQTNGAVLQAALRMDFNKFFQCQVSATAIAPDAVEVSVKPMAQGKPALSLLQTNQSGDFTINLNDRFGKNDELAFLLEVKTSGSAALKHLGISEVLPLAPVALSPVPDAVCTDFATMFRWKAIPLVVEYELQWSRSPDFTAPMEFRITSSQDAPWFMPPEGKLPAPGPWHWRLRGIKGGVLGAWTPTRRFTVNQDHTTRPLRRPLTASKPLFTLEATRVTDYTGFHPDLPPDLMPYAGIIAEGFEGKGMAVAEFARGMDQLPCSILLRSHWVSLADIEWLAQQLPHFIGIQGGEHLSSLYQDNKDGDMVYHHRLTRLCAKYGLLYQEADGTYREDKWQDLMDKQGPFIRQFGPWLVLSQKNNIIRRQFYSQSAAMGLWLGGVTHHHGAWEDGGFYWQNAGFNGLGVCAGERSGVLKTMPRIFWALNFVMGISRGCGLYSLDGQTLMFSPKEAERWGVWPPAIWDTTGKTSDTFNRFVAPLMRAAINHQLIPSKAQVLQHVKLAVYNDMKGGGDGKAWPHYVEYGPLYAATYGFRKMGNIDGQLWEFFPNTGRYYYIPVLPQGNQPLGPGVRNVPVSQLQDLAQVKRVFEAAYPAWYDGAALACRIGDTLTVQNSRENEDVTETYAVPLKAALVTHISGRVGPHAYLVGKLEDQGRRFWFQANTEYPERDTQVSLHCVRQPGWKIAPPAAAKEARWEEQTQSLGLRLSHQAGAVEVEIQ